LSDLIKKDGFTFAFKPSTCSVCQGNCCIGEKGYIWIDMSEIEDLAKHLQISTKELKQRYLFKAKYKYSIKEVKLSDNSFACYFFDLDKKQCSIYEYRPTQCRTFPFWDYFKNNIEKVYEECPAIRDI